MARRYTRHTRRRTVRATWYDTAVDAVMRVIEGATVRVLLLALVLLVASDVIWRVLDAVGVCR